MGTLLDYYTRPSYKFIVRSLLEFFQEDLDTIRNQFVMYGINDFSPVEKIMPQDYTPGFASHPNREVYVFTLDLQTPVSPQEIYDTICDCIRHSTASLVVGNYDDPIEVGYRGKAKEEILDNAAKNDNLKPATISGDDIGPRYSTDFVNSLCGNELTSAVVRASLSTVAPDTNFVQNTSGLMQAAVDAQNKVDTDMKNNPLNPVVNYDKEKALKYTSPIKAYSDDVEKWYVNQDFELINRKL